MVDATITGANGTKLPVQDRYFVQFIADGFEDWNEGSTWAPTEEIGKQLLKVFKDTIENDPQMAGKLNGARYRLVRRYVTNAEPLDEI